MPWCPECRTEYEAGYTTCSDCGAGLVAALPEEVDDPPVVVLRAASEEESQAAEAALRAEGIPVYVQPPGTVLPGDNIVHDSPDLDVLVPQSFAERAVQILGAPPVSDEELDRLAESWPPPD